jgi:catalase
LIWQRKWLKSWAYAEENAVAKILVSNATLVISNDKQNIAVDVRQNSEPSVTAVDSNNLDKFKKRWRATHYILKVNRLLKPIIPSGVINKSYYKHCL